MRQKYPPRPGAAERPRSAPAPEPARRRTAPTPRASSSAATQGTVVNRRAADRLRSGYLWVYASDIVSITLPDSGAAQPPALLHVADARGLLLGTALYSPTSQIALRMVSPE